MGGTTLMDRTIETILAEWRAAEARLEGEPSNVELQELVAVLRDEHAAAIAERKSTADTLREFGAASLA
jgi:hypothetical protein